MVKKAVIVFVVLGGIVRASYVKTTWGFARLFEVLLTCIVGCEECLRPCIVSMTTLLILIKCNPIIGPLSFFITTKCSAILLSPMSNLSLVITNRFSN